jgi:activating signal cointegrator 1
MNVISLSPPYGSLVAALLKRIETRGWATTYRGPLGIHQTAAPGPKGTTEAALWDRCLSAPFAAPLLAAGLGNPARLPRGKIVAVVELVDCWPTTIRNGQACYCTRVDRRGGHNDYVDVSDQERAFGDYTPGRYAWLLGNVFALPEPIPARGMPGLWAAPPDVLAQIAAQLGQAVPS